MTELRWTATQVAAVVHRRILSPAGYNRRGTRCWREDFLRRGIDIYTRRGFTPEHRLLDVSLTLEWVGLPPIAAPGLEYRYEELQTTTPARRDLLAPLRGQPEPSEVLEVVAGPALRWAELGASPQEFIDLLCQPRSLQGPDYELGYRDFVYYWCAAYGSALIGDSDRLRHALRLVEETGPGQHRLDDELQLHHQELAHIFRSTHGHVPTYL